MLLPQPARFSYDLACMQPSFARLECLFASIYPDISCLQAVCAAHESRHPPGHTAKGGFSGAWHTTAPVATSICAMCLANFISDLTGARQRTATTQCQRCTPCIVATTTRPLDDCYTRGHDPHAHGPHQRNPVTSATGAAATNSTAASACAAAYEAGAWPP